MKTIDKIYIVNAPLEKYWQALTDSKVIEAWNAGPAMFDAKKGGQFSLWGGDIHGTNTKILPNELLEQDWYSQNNNEHCYKVSFALSGDGKMTSIHLIHADIPDDDYNDYDEGWKDYYFGPIKSLLEPTT